jgi:hypothetical protein
VPNQQVGLRPQKLDSIPCIGGPLHGKRIRYAGPRIYGDKTSRAVAARVSPRPLLWMQTQYQYIFQQFTEEGRIMQHCPPRDGWWGAYVASDIPARLVADTPQWLEAVLGQKTIHIY